MTNSLFALLHSARRKIENGKAPGRYRSELLLDHLEARARQLSVAVPKLDGPGTGDDLPIVKAGAYAASRRPALTDTACDGAGYQAI